MRLGERPYCLWRRPEYYEHMLVTGVPDAGAPITAEHGERGMPLLEGAAPPRRTEVQT